MWGVHACVLNHAFLKKRVNYKIHEKWVLKPYNFVSHLYVNVKVVGSFLLSFLVLSQDLPCWSPLTLILLPQQARGC